MKTIGLACRFRSSSPPQSADLLRKELVSDSRTSFRFILESSVGLPTVLSPVTSALNITSKPCPAENSARKNDMGATQRRQSENSDSMPPEAMS
ncbi:hypothetical protein RJJ37_21105 [Rhizobium redzepovicii]|uniref:Uncharacterized protein n=1 Tax=Rhizobium redzepovicii TaxID=2867518 RepID=A0AAW8P4V1_9HYPH|nr:MULTISPECIES: hypothetical protein [Rhizobium]MBB3525616.1 hypothetical protein [Rhizobium sp. BK456]MBY4591084.1 hypothetical protein [Rhizobium redzepovicii]MBY4615289.1 hypothetical protein [Rhizobium redzepovicii]MDF0662013.1 hypothetical protein [Rhizobium sp. BC49]MDR9762108.1 hypothetical protein [Rhizobium redzepovicii]